MEIIRCVELGSWCEAPLLQHRRALPLSTVDVFLWRSRQSSKAEALLQVWQKHIELTHVHPSETLLSCFIFSTRWLLFMLTALGIWDYEMDSTKKPQKHLSRNDTFKRQTVKKKIEQRWRQQGNFAAPPSFAPVPQHPVCVLSPSSSKLLFQLSFLFHCFSIPCYPRYSSGLPPLPPGLLTCWPGAV